MPSLTVDFEGGYSNYVIITGYVAAGRLNGVRPPAGIITASLRIILPYPSNVTSVTIVPRTTTGFFNFRFFNITNSLVGSGGGAFNPIWNGNLNNVSFVDVTAQNNYNPFPQYISSVEITYAPQGIASFPPDNDDDSCDKGIHAKKQPYGRDPIGLRDGTKKETATDIQLRSSGSPLVFSRGYDQSKLSDPNFPRVMGLGWSHNHNLFLDATSNANTAYLYLESGGRAHFAKQSSTLYIAKAGGTSAIAVDAASTDARYQLNATDQQYEFDSTGKLRKRTWSNGEEWTYTYYDNTHFANGKLKEVLNTYGTKLQFAYYNEPTESYHLQLRRVGDQTASGLDGTPTGRYFEYGYTQEYQNGVPKSGGLPLLTSIQDFHQNEWTYEYYGLNSGENQSAQYNWLKKHKTPPVDLDGNGTADDYLVVKSLNYVTNNGAITELTQDLGLIGTSTSALETVKYNFLPAQDITTEEIAGRTTTHLFSNGVYYGVSNDLNQSNYQIPNSAYRPFTIQDSNGNPPTALNWSANGKLLSSVVDPLSNSTGFTYDSQDRLLTSTDADGRVTEYTYGDPNVPRQPTEIKVKVGLTTLQHQAFVYDLRGRTLSEKTLDPTDGLTVLREVTRSFYSGNGLLQTITQVDISGTGDTSTTYEYDVLGRVIKTNQSSNFGSCQVSYTVYDAADNVIASICNYANTGTAPTTLAEAIALFDPAYPTENRVSGYVYDSMNRRVQSIAVYAENGMVKQRISLTIYDALSRVTRTIEEYVPQGTSAPGNWLWSAVNDRWENGAGSPIAHDDGVNLISDTSYNARGLVRARRDPLGNVTLYGYDNADRMVRTVQNAAQPSYNNDYDTPANPLGDPDLSEYVVSLQPDQDILTSQVYDANGNVIQTTDVRGISSFTVYDALNRPVRTISNARQSATVSLNPGDIGYTAVNDPRDTAYAISSDPDSDHIALSTYDALGRVIRTQRLMENRQSSSSNAEWDTMLYGYDSLGRQVRTIQHASQPNYNMLVDPDLSEYVISTDVDVDMVNQNVYDDNGRMVASIDVNARTTRYIYDGLGRQTRTVVNFVDNGEAPALWIWSTTTQQWTKANGTTPIDHGTSNDQNIISDTVYNSDGQVESTRNVEGLEQRSGYDAINRQTHSVQNFINVSGGYQPIRDWVWQSGQWRDQTNGIVIQRGTGFDQNLISQTSYDEQGRVLETRDVRGVVMRSVYDARGRRKYSISNYVAQSTAPETWVWNSSLQRWEGGTGTPIDVGTAKNQNLISETIYDRVGRVSKMRDSAGNVTLYVYDRAGRRVRTIQNYIAQGSSDPSRWSYREVNDVWAWRRSPTDNTVISFGPAFDRNHISDTVYNQAGQVLTVLDGRGTETSFLYDASGRRISSSLASGTPIQMIDYTCYDKAGRVLRQIQNYQPQEISPDWVLTDTIREWEFYPETHGTNNDQNLIVEMFYDRASRMNRQIGADGAITDTVYRRDGLTAATVDPLEVVTVYRYDQLNRRNLVVQNYTVQGSSDPANWVFEGGVWKRSASGTPIVHGSSNDQNVIVRLSHDIAGRVTQMRDPRGNVTQYTYDRMGRRLTLTNPLNQTWLTAFGEQANAVQTMVMTYPNATQSVTRTSDPVGRLTQIEYNNPTTTPTVTFEYNLQGRRTRMAESNGIQPVRSADYQYDAAQRLTAVTTDYDGVGTVIETVGYAYDVTNNRTILTMPGAGSIAYTYNARGQLQSIDDINGHRHSFGYDGAGRHNRTTRPGNLSSRYTYSPAGHLKQLSHTRSNRVLAKFEYTVDARGNRTQVTEMLRGPGSNVTAREFVYNTSEITYAGSWTNDAPYKVLNHWEGSLTLELTASQISFTYGTGPDHSLFDVYIGGSLWQTYDGYSPTMGEKTDTIYLDGLETLPFEIRNRPNRNLNSTGEVMRFRRVIAAVDLAMGEIDYTYDALGRLATADYDQGEFVFTYAYDLAGNLTNNNGTVRVYNGANQMVQNGATTLTYDPSGNLITDGSLTYAWDSANRLHSVGTTEYRYNGDGNRVSQTIQGLVTRYLLDTQPGLALVLSETTHWMTTRYLHSPIGIHAAYTATGRSDYLQDGLGSVRAQFTTEIIASQNHTPYGVPIDLQGTFSGSFGYAGEQIDANGLSYNRARHYSPNLAVWLNQDPLETQNRYAYVDGNPVNATDPSGLVNLVGLCGVPSFNQTTSNFVEYDPKVGCCGPDATEWIYREMIIHSRYSERQLYLDTGQLDDQLLSGFLGISLPLNIPFSDLIGLAFYGLATDYKRIDFRLTQRQSAVNNYSTSLQPNYSCNRRQVITVCGKCQDASDYGNFIYGLILKSAQQSHDFAMFTAGLFNINDRGSHEDRLGVDFGYLFGQQLNAIKSNYSYNTFCQFLSNYGEGWFDRRGMDTGCLIPCPHTINCNSAGNSLAHYNSYVSETVFGGNPLFAKPSDEFFRLIPDALGLP